MEKAFYVISYLEHLLKSINGDDLEIFAQVGFDEEVTNYRELSKLVNLIKEELNIQLASKKCDLRKAIEKAIDVFVKTNKIDEQSARIKMIILLKMLLVFNASYRDLLDQVAFQSEDELTKIEKIKKHLISDQVLDLDLIFNVDSAVVQQFTAGEISDQVCRCTLLEKIKEFLNECESTIDNVDNVDKLLEAIEDDLMLCTLALDDSNGKYLN